jgi:hypothetical protein
MLSRCDKCYLDEEGKGHAMRQAAASGHETRNIFAGLPF